MEGQDQRERRKLQNRIAQRRFRSRKKGGETAFLQADLEITESGRENPKVREATFDQPKAPIGTVSSDFHGIGGEVDFNTMLIDEATDDLFAGLSEAFVSKPWLKSSYISPPPSEESDRVNVWKVDDSLGSLVNATARVSMDSTNRQNNTLEDKLTMAECSKSPSALNVGKATALSGPRPIAASEPLYTTTGCSPAIRYSEGSSQKANPIHQDNQRSLSAGTNNDRAGCCVAHKAESMVADLQRLYNYGLYFGFFETEDDEVEDCLGFLKAKLKEMAQCPSGNAVHSSLSNSDVG